MEIEDFNSTETKYDVLYKKIMSKLNSSRVEKSDEIVSMLDVVNSVKSCLELYNVILLKNQKSVIKKLNRSLGYNFFVPKFVTKKLPRVQNIYNKIEFNGNTFIKLVFEDGRRIALSGNHSGLKIFATDFDKDESLKFINSNMEIFSIFSSTLLAFASEYPGVEMTWGEYVRNPYNQLLSDGFISCDVRLTEPDKVAPVFTKCEDNRIALEHSGEYGTLYDYISFYGDEVLAKSAVKVDGLNPFIRSCVNKSNKEVKNIELTLSK